MGDKYRFQQEVSQPRPLLYVEVTQAIQRRLRVTFAWPCKRNAFLKSFFLNIFTQGDLKIRFSFVTEKVGKGEQSCVTDIWHMTYNAKLFLTFQTDWSSFRFPWEGMFFKLINIFV